MRQGKANVDSVSIESATSRSRMYTEDVIQKAERLSNDTDKEQRLEKLECKCCFYVQGRIGGAAVTSRMCGICGDDMIFGSTNTDVICSKCAGENGLCKHCGGDMEMKVRRSKRSFQK